MAKGKKSVYGDGEKSERIRDFTQRGLRRGLHSKGNLIVE